MSNKGVKTSLRLSLIENALDSLNESLAYVEAASTDPNRWKFAVLNLVHAVELMIKQRLHQEHELLLWENVDQPGKTVSLEKAITRLTRSGVVVETSELNAIRTAIRWRNNITHFEVDLIAEEVRENYLLIFEFLDSFHQQHFLGSLSDRIADAHVRTAMDLVNAFNKEFIEFRGRRMHRRWPRLLVAAQRTKEFVLKESRLARLPWGSESRWSTWMKDDEPLEFCRDCGAAVGEYHGPNCTQEECPNCHGQLATCECDFDNDDFWGLDETAFDELPEAKVDGTLGSDHERP